ncbi:MAG: SDR family oxidoreductase [Alphaproteobacteria bacterium]|nr:SDR family oxidoreductase [Alphaproteobacteria bacterium]
MILLTGITGKTCGPAVRLMAGKVKMRAIVRTPDKAAAFKDLGVEIVAGDAGDPAVVASAAKGCDKAVIIMANTEKQAEIEKQFIDTVKAAGVKHVVKMSSTEAEPGVKSSIPLNHLAVEDYLKASGLAWTLLKPNFFVQNFVSMARGIKANGSFAIPCGTGTTAMIDARDIGAALAAVLMGTGHEGQAYELTGPEIMTFTQVAEKFSSVLGKPIRYVDLPMAEYKKIMSQFLTNPWHLNAVCELFSEIAEGGLNRTTDTFKKLTGRAPGTLAQFLQENAALFA